MRLFENKFAGDQSTEIDNSSVEDVNKSVVEKFIQKVPSEEEEKQSSTGLENKKHDVEEIETDNTINSVDIEDNKSHTEQKIEEQTSVEDHEKNILISNDLPELQIENTSDINEIILISDDEEKSSEISSNDVKELKIDKVDNSSSIIIIDDEEKSSEISSNNLKELKINNVDTSSSIIIIDDSKEETNEKYPEDLNPFGDEEEEPTTKPNTSLNPFGDDEDEIEEKKPSPKPAVRRKIKPSNRELLVSGQSDGTPEYISELRMQRISMNRFEVDEHSKIGDKPRAHTMKLISPSPRINLNPFWSDGEEPDDDEEDEKQRPIPLPRNSRGSIGTPEPKPRKSGLSITSGLTRFGSNTSLSSAHSSIGPAGRKKKQAPKPPSIAVDSAHSSVTSSPSVSAQHSPKLTPRIRKTKKAPLPPSVTSTPFLDAKIQQKLFSMDVSPIGNEESKEATESTVATETGEWEKEKNLKDEVNRNRQSQAVISPVSSSENSANLSVPNKSTYGKWKRRKGPAPSRPIPQRRNIKPLPVTEIKRELELIEIQQQGLEKQGVRLEQIIREKCEGPNVDLESSLAPETEDLILQLFELVNEKNELFRKQAELMYLRRQQRLEEEYADLEYQIRCLMMQPEANKTDTDKTREEELISRLVEVVERRNEIVECLEMDRVRESEEDDSINVQLNLYASKREEDTSGKVHLDANKQKKKGKKEKKFKFKSNKKVDVDKDIDECESSSTTSAAKDKKKKKFNIF